MAVQGGNGHPPLVSPHVITDLAEVQAVVDDLLNEPYFVIDIETTKDRPRNNSLLWVGLGAAARCYLIPLRHRRGRLIRAVARRANTGVHVAA